MAKKPIPAPPSQTWSPSYRLFKYSKIQMSLATIARECGLIKTTADFFSCGRWEGLTGKELELEHQEERADVWLMFS